jgi:hypothetical protein
MSAEQLALEVCFRQGTKNKAAFSILPNSVQRVRRISAFDRPDGVFGSWRNRHGLVGLRLIRRGVS